MPEPTAQNPPADWSWQTHPDVVWWDWRQGPDLDELRQALGRHGVTLAEVDTGTDDVAVRIGSTPVEVMEDALCRRVWAAAVRWFATRTFTATQARIWHKIADQIEAGTLTPWEQNLPAGPPSVAVEPPAAPGASTATPEAAEAEFGACCDLHGRNCEPPSELCCEGCTEVRHPFHPPGVDCTWASKEDVQFGQAVQRLAGHPDTPEAHSGAEGLILGRALVDGDGRLSWRDPHPWVGAGAEPVEVLLVPVGSGPVLKAAVRLVHAWDADPFSPQTAAAKAALGVAVDAATSRQHEGGTQPAPTPSPGDEGGTEPGGDGPGWDRCGIDHLIAMMDGYARNGEGEMPVTVNDADQLRGLLAHVDLRGRMLRRAEYERNTARAELAEVSAERDRYRELLAERGALEQIGDDPRDQLRRDTAADALEWAAGLVGDPVGSLTAIAAQVRSGEREIPTTRQDGDQS